MAESASDVPDDVPPLDKLKADDVTDTGAEVDFDSDATDKPVEEEAAGGSNPPVRPTPKPATAPSGTGRRNRLLAVRARLARVDRRLTVGLGAFAATLLTLAAVAIAARGPIIARVSRAEAIYVAVGLGPVTLGRGLEIGQVASKRESKAGQDILSVSGLVSNVSEQSARLPLIRVSLYDAEDNEVHTVTLPRQQDMLGAGESLSFATTISEAPAAARRIRVGFAAEHS